MSAHRTNSVHGSIHVHFVMVLIMSVSDLLIFAKNPNCFAPTGQARTPLRQADSDSTRVGDIYPFQDLGLQRHSFFPHSSGTSQSRPDSFLIPSIDKTIQRELYRS
jgi:hypothetical protein